MHFPPERSATESRKLLSTLLSQRLPCAQYFVDTPKNDRPHGCTLFLRAGLQPYMNLVGSIERHSHWAQSSLSAKEAGKLRRDNPLGHVGRDHLEVPHVPCVDVPGIDLAGA